MRRLAVLILMATALSSAQIYTRGVGIYPGDPREDFGPVLRVDATTYRNLALHRPAYHSSSYDYNLTAQLVTDGITDTKMPRWVATATSADGYLKKNEWEWILDHNPFTHVELRGSTAWVQIELRGGDTPLEIDRIDVGASAGAVPDPAWTCVVSGSDDGRAWKELGRAAASGPEIKPSIQFSQPSRSRLYRIEFHASGTRM